MSSVMTERSRVNSSILKTLLAMVETLNSITTKVGRMPKQGREPQTPDVRELKPNVCASREQSVSANAMRKKQSVSAKRERQKQSVCAKRERQKPNVCAKRERQKPNVGENAMRKKKVLQTKQTANVRKNNAENKKKKERKILRKERRLDGKQKKKNRKQRRTHGNWRSLATMKQYKTQLSFIKIHCDNLLKIQALFGLIGFQN